MERGETRVEKATRFVGDNFDGIEWHVYRMGHITDYFIGTARVVRRDWRAFDVDGREIAQCKSRGAAISELCRADDIQPETAGGYQYATQPNT